MRFNVATCNMMRVSWTHNPRLFNYSLTEQVLEEVMDDKYLGVIYILSVYSLFSDIVGHLLCRLQMTQPTSGGAVTANSSCCANLPAPAMGARFTVFLGMLAMRTHRMAGAIAYKSGCCQDQSRSLNKKVWICDICHKQIHVVLISVSLSV